MKIERNALCPCRSGRKYKKCCLAHPERGEISSILNAQYIDRDYIFADLKQRSATMARFLENLPVQLVERIWIFNDPQLNSTMRCAAANNHFCIIVKELPIDDADFFDFAHEIGHLILTLKNYPTCEIIPGDMKLSVFGTVLMNTIMDPLVNRLVIQHGFDLDAYMRKITDQQLPTVRSTTHNTFYDCHILRCLCIEKMLEWRLLDIQFENPLSAIFQELHQAEYDFAQSFVDAIDISRLDDPQYVREKLSTLINENQMARFLRLI